MQGKTRNNFKVVVAILGIFAIFVSLIAMSLCESNQKIANAASATIYNKKIDVTLSVSDESGKTSTSLDRDYYSAGDEAVITWTGASDGNNIIIPTTIDYGQGIINVADLVRSDLVQSKNSEYVRRMGEAATLCDFNTLKSYIEKSHSVNLGTLHYSADIKVTYQTVTPVYRLYNMITSEHLFTANRDEYDMYVLQGKYDSEYWIGEGISWLAPASGQTVYRLYNATLGSQGRSSHYYTTNATEIEQLKNAGWVIDNGGQDFKSGGSTAIWTSYNEALGSAHHYTTSVDEWRGLSLNGWDIEETKNGAYGVFSAVLGLSWTFDSNYYFVEHKINGEVEDTQIVSAGSEVTTNAQALSYPGYQQKSLTNTDINFDNTSIASVDYETGGFTLTFDKNGEGVASIKHISYGSTVNTPSTPNSNGKDFVRWTYDPEGQYAFDFTRTRILAGKLTLYAQWDKVDVDTTGKKVRVEFNFNMGNMSSHVTEVTYGDVAIAPDAPTDLKTNKVNQEGQTRYYHFDGWYTLPDGEGELWDFDTKIKNRLVLYAKWVEVWK